MRHKLVSAIFSYLLNNHKGHLIGGRNWARDIKPFKPENEDGHRTPSLDEIRLFQGAFTLGTKERLLFDLAYLHDPATGRPPPFGSAVPAEGSLRQRPPGVCAAQAAQQEARDRVRADLPRTPEQSRCGAGERHSGRDALPRTAEASRSA